MKPAKEPSNFQKKTTKNKQKTKQTKNKQKNARK